MTDAETLTAVLLQLSDIGQQLADLDHRAAGDIREIREQIKALASSLAEATAAAAGHSGAIEGLAVEGAAIAGRIADQAAGDSTSGDAYQPAPSPRLWKPGGRECDDTVARLRAWVDQVYRPGYGHLAASLADCWDQHPLCLYALDWLSELWTALYLQPRRTAAILAGQAEWQTRLLTAVSDQLAQETRRCGHASVFGHAPRTAGAQP